MALPIVGSGAHAQDAPFDAATASEAAGIIATSAAGIEVSRRWCGKTFPDLKKAVDLAALTWRDRNGAVLRVLAAQNALDLANAESTAAVAFEPVRKLNNEQQTAYCRQFVSVAPSGALDVELRTPRAAAFVAANLNAHPLTERQARSYNFEMSCMKSAANRGADLDASHSFCGCTWSAMSATFSADEWREYDAAVAAKHSVSKLPQVQRVAPALQVCARQPAMRAQ